MTNHLVTIIMPCYNSENTLFDSINSVLNNTYSEFELIIVNDGSTDGSLKVAESFTDRRIHLINRSENRGLIYTLNEGLECANGKYILRLDSDDCYLRNSIEVMINFIEKVNADFIFGNAQIIDEKGSYMGETKKLNDHVIRKVNVINSIIHSSVCFRKELIEELGNYNKDCLGYEDQELWYRFFRANKKMYHLDKSIVKYRIVKNSCQIRDSSDYYFLVAQYLFRFGDKSSALLLLNKVNKAKNKLIILIRYFMPLRLAQYISFKKVKNNYKRGSNGIYRPK
ncbi:glycosyltransferase [Pseudoalteromonas sp. NZS100]|uniref:glycosyltransferase n=1 Tax=Pseudoalteromonas sp. NZS100 TaxID=2792046 RepID=UPI0018CD1EF3|nr:glycosyltransferase [Pseudoalteromonas sp. NZS100]MBH0066668.1 glycosyltransferase [Pseudoalteromonas sp. NZS100]